MHTNKPRQSQSLLKQRQMGLQINELRIGQNVSLSPQKMHQLTFYQRLRLYYKSQNTLTPKPWNVPDTGTVLRFISVHEVMKHQKKELQARMPKLSQDKVSKHQRFLTEIPKIQADVALKKIKLNFKPILQEIDNSFGPWDHPA